MKKMNLKHGKRYGTNILRADTKEFQELGTMVIIVRKDK